MFESQHNSSLPPAVFGRLVGGEDILAKIERVPVDPATNRPLKPVTLKDVAIFADPYDAYKKKLEKRIVREQEEREGAGIKAAKKAERDGDRTTCASLRGGCNDADWRFWGEQVVRNRLEQAGADGVGAGGRDGGGSGQVPWSGDDGGTEEKGGTCGSWNPEEEAEGRGRVRRVLGLVILYTHNDTTIVLFLDNNELRTLRHPLLLLFSSRSGCHPPICWSKHSVGPYAWQSATHSLSLARIPPFACPTSTLRGSTCQQEGT